MLEAQDKGHAFARDREALRLEGKALQMIHRSYIRSHDSVLVSSVCPVSMAIPKRVNIQPHRRLLWLRCCCQIDPGIRVIGPACCFLCTSPLRPLLLDSCKPHPVSPYGRRLDAFRNGRLHTKAYVTPTRSFAKLTTTPGRRLSLLLVHPTTFQSRLLAHRHDDELTITS